MGTTAIIACATSGATIYYTLDGSTPTSSSTQYTSAITLTQSCMIKAIAVKSGMSDSEVASESYVHYLTAWRLVGNSSVHTDPYLTSWKVSGNSQIQQYLTQWKVSGNSVVDNNAILSCGDLGQDGKYHVKISNGVDVFDIALTEPLRKVNDVADTIEFANGTATVTRNIGFALFKNMTFIAGTASGGKYRWQTYYIRYLAVLPEDNDILGYLMCNLYSLGTGNDTYRGNNCIALERSGILTIYDSNYDRSDCKDDLLEHIKDSGVLYAKITPTTETIDVPQISVSPTNTYSSANTTPYSAFTYANPLIYSCGDYSDVDGKYHVKISNGVTIFDIPLDAPLRKVNDVADTIEFPSGTEGKALVIRNIVCVNLGELSYGWGRIGSNPNYCLENNDNFNISPPANNDRIVDIVCPIYTSKSYRKLYTGADTGIGLTMQGYIRLRDSNYDYADGKEAFVAHLQGIESLFILATPTTELVDVSPFAVSPTDTYTSANETTYSEFEHTEHKEIWSCGEYNATDDKWHILVQSQGGSIADIALTEPLRMVDNVADTIEFPSGTDGKALVTRNITSYIITQSSTFGWDATNTASTKRMALVDTRGLTLSPSGGRKNVLCPLYNSLGVGETYSNEGISIAGSNNGVGIRDANYDCLTDESKNAFKAHVMGMEILYVAVTPTTELVDAPQIEEAESYTCVTIPGSKALGWSGFEIE